MIIIQAKFSNSFVEDPLLKLSRVSKNLLDLEFDRTKFEGRYCDRVLTSFDLFRKTYMSLISKKPKLSIIYHYVSKGIEVHPNVQRQANDLVDDVSGMFPDARVEVKFLGADALLKMSQFRSNDVHRLKVAENPMSSSGQVFIALVNLADYYEFLTDEEGKLIKHLFESNVRDYQGKTNVNNEIQKTLQSIDDEDFWWLNNGVTIVASEVSAPGRKELIIHNPEIVNGLQTSSEIHRYFSWNIEKVDTEKRNILVRVIVPESEETRDRIIRATNSQTSIPKSSLRVTDPIHRQIEDYMKPRGLFYDRRKNYYKNEGKKPREIISVSFLAQCLMSVLVQKPDFARARPSTLLDDENVYNKLYNMNNDLNTYYVISYLGRETELKLKLSGTYSSAEINDIRFYVLYAVCVKLTGQIRPTNRIIAALTLDDVEQIIATSIDLVFSLYKSLGGNEKIAKGNDLTSRLKVELIELISVTGSENTKSAM